MQVIEYIVSEFNDGVWVPIYYADCERACKRFIMLLSEPHNELRLETNIIS